MNEKRFTADGTACILIWKAKEDGSRVPCLRLYDPRDPETGWAKRKPDGSPPDFKDYEMRVLTDPSLKILDEAGAFEFVETDDGECYFDFSLKALGMDK